MTVQTTLLDWTEARSARSSPEFVQASPVEESMPPPDSIEAIRERVLTTMHELGIAPPSQVDGLRDVPLGRLRRDATRLHAVCRYRRKPKQDGPLLVEDVREVALHPDALRPEWSAYAHFLLFHEFLHALGHVRHDRRFRELEGRWPDTPAREMGESFGKHLRERHRRWRWTCTKCGLEHARNRRSNGRYLCRTCGKRLKDVPLERQDP